MRLLYLYVEGFGVFKNGHPVEMNFTSDYRFMLSNVDGVKELVCQRSDTLLPDYFFSLDGTDSGVEEVSVVVGENGSGKTTLARLLQRVRMVDAERIRFVMVLEGSEESSRGWHCLSTIQGLKLPTGPTPKDGYSYVEGVMNGVVNIEDRLKGLFDFVYYSPYATTEDAFDVHDDPSCCNLSSKALLQRRPDYYFNKVIGVGDDQRALYGAYAYEQYKWQLEFLAWFSTLSEADRCGIVLPVPLEIVLTPNDNMYSVSKEVLLEYARHDRFSVGEDVEFTMRHYKEVVDVLIWLESYGDDLFFRAFGTFYVNYWRNARIPNREVLEREDSFGAELHRFMLNVLQAKNTVTRNVAIVRITRKLEDMQKGYTSILLGEGGLAAVCQLFKMFGTMCKDAPLPGCKMKLFSVDDPLAKSILECVRLHSLARPVNDFLAFQFYPPMSSGEITFLSMFARLYWFLTNSSREKSDVLVFLDESETALHPEWQRSLVHNVIWLFGKVRQMRGLRDRVHLIFGTHSPMLLSDIPIGNAVFLKRKQMHDKDRDYACAETRDVKCARVGFTNTFAANIFDLYNMPFFLDEGTTGRFADGKLGRILPLDEDVKGLEPKDRRCVVGLIGDPFLRGYYADALNEGDLDAQ